VALRLIGPIVLLALGLHLGLALTHDGYLGVDGGAYLLSRNAVLGDEPTGAGFPRPPLAPGWQLVPFTHVLGDDIGYKVWAAIAATMPLLGGWLLARRFLPRFQLPFMLAFLAVDLLHAEMFVTGALPLQGFALIAAAMWAMCSLAERKSWAPILVLALSLPAIAHINQTSSGLAALYIPVFWLALSWFRREWQLRSLAPILAGGLLAMSALPWYLDIAPNSSILHYPGAWVFPSSWADVSWWQVAAALPVGYWAARYATDPALRALGVVTVALGLMLPWLSTDETVINVFYRSRYLLAIPWYICMTWIVFTYWIPGLLALQPGKRAVGALAGSLTAVALGVMAVGAVWQFHNQAKYSDMVTSETADALRQLRAEGSAGIITNSFTFSLWVAALNKVESPHVWTWTPPRAYTETDIHVRCILGWTPGCDPGRAREVLGVSHVLIDTRFPDYNPRAPAIYMAPEDPWGVTAETPWLELVYSDASTRLWRIT
jgi:hypothetical protein